MGRCLLERAEPALAELALEVEEAELVAPQPVGATRLVPWSEAAARRGRARARVLPSQMTLEGIDTAAAPEVAAARWHCRVAGAWTPSEQGADGWLRHEMDPRLRLVQTQRRIWLRRSRCRRWLGEEMDTAPEEAAILPFPKAVSTGVPEVLQA